MKTGRKTFLAGILVAVMIAGSSVTVLAAETSQIPEENSQSVTQQDKQPTEKKAGKNKTAADGENFKNGRHHRKDMISEEINKPKHHFKNKSAEDVQTTEDGTETSKRRLHKKSKSTSDESTEQTENV